MNQQQTDELYIKIAEAMASNSKAERLKVGAVLVKDDHIIAAGYNGTPRGTDNACEDENGNTYPWVVHAEENVLIQAARSTNSTIGSTLYITHSPCESCAKLIIQAGITRVVYKNYYGEGGVILLRCGVGCEQLSTTL